MRISPQTIQRIKDSADIVDVVQDFLSLKKKGQNYWACCPFHNEKSPSFSVAPAKGIYKCFGCGAAGDSVKFVMDLEGLSYPEALKYLANKYNIEIEEDNSVATDEYKAQQSLRESVLIAMQFAQRYYQNILHHDNEGKALGMTYFRERGFSLQTIEKFGLGYSRDDWHDFHKSATKEGFAEEILEKAGLIIKKEENEKSNLYDRFRNRVMFPIYDLAGKVIAFGARILKKDEKQPKYLNSPENEVYKKSDVLYGIFQAKNEIRNQDNCYLCEGYTDVISLHQAGIQNVVASSGTSLTEGQIKLVKRFTDNITVLYDGDNAGIKASLRGIDLILEQGLNVRAVVFPHGEDPDSYVQKIGSLYFKEFLIENTKDFITFKAELLLGEVKTDPIRKAGAIRDITNSISKVPDGIKREIYAKHCAELFDIDTHTLLVEIDKTLIQKGLQEDKRKQEEQRKNEEKQKRQKEDNLPSYLNDIPLPTEEYYIDIPIYQEEAIQILDELQKKETKSLQKTIAVHERECMRLLLKYGNYQVDSQVKLWQYLLAEIEELQFHTPLYFKMLTMYREAISQGIEADDSYMIRYGTPDVVETVVNITSEKYQASENWELMHEIIIPHESDVERLPNTVYTYVLRHKYKFIVKLLKEIEEKLDAVTEEELVQLLEEYHRLNQIKKSMLSDLGTVILPE
jgi:DNA primase